MNHESRKHSKFSASGAERYFNCPGSVALSEGLPDKPNIWSKEGTTAHEVLEKILNEAVSLNQNFVEVRTANAYKSKDVSDLIIHHGMNAANFILRPKRSLPDSEILVESRVHLHFIHPEMFGTFDGAVVDHFGVLHVFDYKYGVSPVSPVKNLQMIFYGLGLAHFYNWNFKTVRLWIIQPRVKGYDGPTFWDVSILELKNYIKHFEIAVNRVIREPNFYNEGSWCHFCKARAVCPIKRGSRNDKAKKIFET